MKNISVLVLASIIALSSIPVSGETAANYRKGKKVVFLVQ